MWSFQDSREKAMYNQCGGGFTTIPSQPPRDRWLCLISFLRRYLLSLTTPIHPRPQYAMFNEPPRPIFQRRSGEPAGFYLHKSIKSDFQRETLKDQIIVRNYRRFMTASACLPWDKKNGGKVQDEDRGADTVLVDPKHLTCELRVLQLTYSTSRDKEMQKVVVESLSFVQRCLSRNEFAHHLLRREAMGGHLTRYVIEISGNF